MTAMEYGRPPVANGEPFTTVKAPLVGLIANAETSLEPAFVTNRNLPSGVTASEEGELPAAYGAPVMGVSAPEFG